VGAEAATAEVAGPERIVNAGTVLDVTLR